MKQSPDMKKLEQMLRSSVLVVGGFMGNDPRPVTEVIDEDAAILARLDVTAEQVAARMQEITDAAVKGYHRTAGRIRYRIPVIKTLASGVSAKGELPITPPLK